MYSQDALSVSLSDDGKYLLSFQVRKKKSKESKGVVMGMDSESKTHIAASPDDLLAEIKELLPLLKKGYMEEDEYLKAFKEEKGEKGE